MLVLLVQIWLKATVSKYSSELCGMTGNEAARLVLSNVGAYDVSIISAKGELTDHYDPAANSISLSETTYGVNSVAAVGIAAHEAGHAAQYHENYAPAKLRQSTVKVCNIGSRFAIPLIFLGYIFAFEPLVVAGIVCFGLVVVFQLITLPVEFNASRRAVQILSASGRLSKSEIKGVKRVLTAAAMTYVGALAVTSVQLFYYVTRLRRK